MPARSLARRLSRDCLALCHAHCPWYWACSSISPSARRRILCSPIEDCLLQLPFAAASCFLRLLWRSACARAHAAPQNSFRSPARPPSSPLLDYYCCTVRYSFGLSTRALPSPFLLHAAAQIASHLQPSRAPPPRSVSWACQTLPLSRDSYHIVPSSLPAYLHRCTPRRLLILLAAALRPI
jgi:hypothetical protein